MSSPPGSTAKRQRMSSMRTSLSNRTPLRNSQSSLPIPSQPPNVSRIAASQPSYDFISGGSENPPPSKRTMLRKPSFSRLDHSADENLRAKLNSLEYEMQNLQQERNMLTLQHDKEMRDLQMKADTDFKKYQAAELASQKALQRYESLQKEVRGLQDQNINDKGVVERRLRDVQDENASLKEDAADAQARLSDSERHYKHQLNDVEAKRASLQETVDKLREDVSQLTKDFDNSQSRLTERNAEVAALETQVLELKAHSADSDAQNVLQNQLSEQVSHIRNLESANREQGAELRRLRDQHRSVQIVEEQKRGLETELQVLRDVERQLGEAQIQKEILLDEKRQWTSMLERDGEEPEFTSPEAVVKALVEARIQIASLSERVGSAEADAAEKDQLLKALDMERSKLRNELETIKSKSDNASETLDNKAYKRLERQNNLAIKETEYLRAQLSSFDSEETMENPSFDNQRAEQIKQLEALVDKYKEEVSSLHGELAKAEPAPASSEPRGTKRRAESQDGEADSSAQIGPLLRKNKNLQVALQKTAQQSQMLATELQSAKSQLKSLRESARIRVLELRDNPTANAEAIKMTTLRTLKDENRDLLSQMRGESLQGVKVVPVSTLDALKLELQAMEQVVADKEKRMRRQREIWTDKAAEFRDVVASVLGWKITFMPNGKAKVASMFYGKPGEESDDDDENYIIFDGENGTMKISGGADGAFAREIKEQVDFWVKEKKEIPGFLAALTIQFHDEYRSR
jgi:mitotic spindle assembly checkpoint protein MAD1